MLLPALPQPHPFAAVLPRSSPAPGRIGRLPASGLQGLQAILMRYLTRWLPEMLALPWRFGRIVLPVLPVRLVLLELLAERPALAQHCPGPGRKRCQRLQAQLVAQTQALHHVPAGQDRQGREPKPGEQEAVSHFGRKA